MNLPTWLLYILITLIVSIPFYWQVVRQGGAQSEGFPRQFRLMLWIPGIVALGFRLSQGLGLSGISFSLSRWPLLILAFYLPLAVELIVITVAVRFDWRAIPPEILQFTDGEVQIGDKLGLFLRGQKQSRVNFAANLVLSMTIGGLLGAFNAFGQEFGWRGFLMGEATEAVGLARGLLIVGLAWGAWYFPLIQAGFRYPSHPGLGGFLLMPLSLIAVSIVSGWLYQTADSILAPTLLHASLLVTSDLSLVGLGDQGADLRVRFTWIVTWLTIAILATFFWPQLLA